MLQSCSLAALAALLATPSLAAQFVMYAAGGDTDSVQRIDPIISPGTISAHVHQVFGAASLKSDMTYDSLQNMPCTSVGSAGGKGNMADRSVYWHPALFAQAKDGSGLIRIPTNGHKLYYQESVNSKDKKANPFQFPKGFRMVAGDPFMRAANTDIHKQNITQWICHSKSGQNQGTDGGFPDNVQDCEAYPFFNGAITFPSCWSGADFDPANPTAHISYPEGDVSAGPCPASHPTRLPKIFIENQFDLHSVVDKIKPNTFVLAQGDSTGYGWHADFFNGWQDGAIPSLLASCPPAKYGNQDAGGCSAFQAGSATKECKLPVQYTENVDTPGNALPGCNPITNTNPAPRNAIAALGSNTCGANDAPAYGGAAASSVAAVPTTTAAPADTDPNAVPVPEKTTIFNLPTAYSGMTTLLTTTRSQVQLPAYAASPAAEAGSGTQSSSASCPGSNGQTYTSNGKSFTVECGVDHMGGDLGMKQVKSLAECIDQCAQTSGCVDVSLSGVACYMKKKLGKASNNAGVNGAKLISGDTAAAPTQPATYGKSVDAASDGDADVVIVTEIKTVTAMATAYMTA